MTFVIRPFADRDFPEVIAITGRIVPEWQESEAEARHRYAAWDRERFHLYRVVAEHSAGFVVGWGQIYHAPDQFHPDKYYLEINVEPTEQRRGVGSALYDHLLERLRARGAILVRAEAKESMAASIAFLERRGFSDVQRGWESRLDVARFDVSLFSDAERRVAAQGITITTLAAELSGNPDAARAAYQLYLIGSRDAEVDEVTDVPFDHFLRYQIEDPSALLDAYFLAKDGDRLVGQSMLVGSEAEPDVLHQDLTAVLPEYRGRGIAMALKVRTTAYARERGKREIRTWNNTRNRPMLRINEAMGFVKQPVWIVFQKDLAGAAPAAAASRE